MQNQTERNSLAIVKYYDTSTKDGLFEKLQDNAIEMQNLSAEVMLSIAEPFLQWQEEHMKRKREAWLLNDGNLEYLERQEEIQGDLKDLAARLHLPKEAEKNRALLEDFRKKWGEAVSVQLGIDYQVKTHARKKYILHPNDTIQFQRLTCEDMFGNFRFIEMADIPKSQYVAIEESLARILTRISRAQDEEREEYRKSCQYQFFSLVRNHPITFVTITIFLSLLAGIATGCAAEYALENPGNRLLCQ